MRTMKISLLRHVTQIAAFIASNLGVTSALKTGIIYPFFYCYGCPLAVAACPIGTLQHFVIAPGVPPCLYLLGTIGIYGTIFGRAFCGWACPFGSLQDLLGNLKGKKRKSASLRPFTYSKFAMLLIVMGLAWWTLDTFFCKFCPIGTVFGAIPSLYFYSTLNRGVFFYYHLITLSLTVGLVLVFSRFWCRYLCPVGPIGVFNRISIVNLFLDPAECVECKRCLNICPMKLDKLSDIGLSSDCIMCGKCVEECHTDALKFVLGKRG